MASIYQTATRPVKKLPMTKEEQALRVQLAAAYRIFDVVESHAPGFRGSVVGHSALSPSDLEREFGLTGGDIFHGQLSLDQLWSARPVLGHADYRTPLKGL